MGNAAQVAHDHTKAVVERHRDNQAIFLGEQLAFGYEIAVVQDVVVSESGTLGITCGA